MEAGVGGWGKGSQGHGIESRTRGRVEVAEKARGREGRGGEGRRKRKPRRKKGDKRGGGGKDGIGATPLRPARCSYTRWRVDGEALAAERPSCSLGYLPIKAGTLLFTQDKAIANPTGSERQPPPEIPLIPENRNTAINRLALVVEQVRNISMQSKTSSMNTPHPRPPPSRPNPCSTTLEGWIR